MIQSLIKFSATVSVMTFISRIFGLIRDIVIAKFFGANLYADVFFVAFKIPNLLRRLFSEGAFQQAFVPILSHAKSHESDQEVQVIINVIGSKLLKILVITTAIAIVIAPIIIFVFASGFYGTNKFDLAVDMLRITFPYLIFVSLTAFSGAILNTHNRFAVAAFTPTLLNIAIILSVIFLSEHLKLPVLSLAWGVFIGGVLQLLFQVPFLIKIKRLPRLTKQSSHPQYTLLKKRILPALTGVGATQINLLIDMILASYLVTGSISWLYYANRLFEFPLALLAIAFTTVSLPQLSKYYAKGQLDKFQTMINNTLKLLLLLAIPASVGLIMLSQPLIITLFQYGAFNAIDVQNTALAVLVYGYALAAFVFVKVFAQVFYARGDTKTPAYISVVAIAVNIVLNLILISPLAYLGLAIATSISAVVNAGLLYIFLHKRQIYQINFHFVQLFFKIIIASALMALLLYFIAIDNAVWLAKDVWQRLITLFIHIGSAALLYFAVLFILRIKIKQ